MKKRLTEEQLKAMQDAGLTVDDIKDLTSEKEDKVPLSEKLGKAVRKTHGLVKPSVKRVRKSLESFMKGLRGE